jgi:FtsP/CotA-like multicopper oxidase with cupredoxin domain
LHHWEGWFVPMIETTGMQSSCAPQTIGSEVDYKYATFNAHRPGHGESLRLKAGQRVLMRLLNASATENCVLALPGHKFRILTMDGNSVLYQREVETLSLAVAECVDAIVEMNNPGVWILGSTIAKERDMGLGLVVEFGSKSGPSVWNDPASAAWNCPQSADSGPAPDVRETFTLTFRDSGPLNDLCFDTWTINNKSWPNTDMLKVQRVKRYRHLFRNGSGDQHPMHLHRQTFEVTRIGGKQLRGLMKDVINIVPLDTVAVHFVTDNPGETLMHCHQQLHKDHGFMQLIRYV